MAATTKQINKRIKVDLTRMKLYAYEGDKVVFEFHCTSGREGKETDPGLHRILRKEHPYRSKTYNVQMDYAMFFTKDGKAIHQSAYVTLRSFGMWAGMSFLGSHGCVGLAEADAKALYEWTPLHTVVEVVNKKEKGD
jgi:lipoprotein-anchoring transpeptidase ErfK/SrfK